MKAEINIKTLRFMGSGNLEMETTKELTEGYIKRIKAIDQCLRKKL